METFWANIDLDLTGATLLNLGQMGCHISIGRFRGVKFAGDAWFGDAEFAGDPWFGGARFESSVEFRPRWHASIPAPIQPAQPTKPITTWSLVVRM
jgi:hypothetical protein